MGSTYTFAIEGTGCSSLKNFYKLFQKIDDKKERNHEIVTYFDCYGGLFVVCHSYFWERQITMQIKPRMYQTQRLSIHQKASHKSFVKLQ